MKQDKTEALAIPLHYKWLFSKDLLVNKAKHNQMFTSDKADYSYGFVYSQKQFTRDIDLDASYVVHSS